MFDAERPHGLFDIDAFSPRSDLSDYWADPLAGSASFSLNLDVGPPDESPSSLNATLTFFVENPGPNVCFRPAIGELTAGKAGLSEFDEVADMSWSATSALREFSDPREVPGGV